jgi:hypothetical protein
MTQAENRNITNLSGRTVVAGLSNRRSFIGGSDARIIMGQDEKASIRVHRRLKNPHKPRISVNKVCTYGLAGPRMYLYVY